MLSSIRVKRQGVLSRSMENDKHSTLALAQGIRLMHEINLKLFRHGGRSIAD
jgi:hypothetical protein